MPFSVIGEMPGYHKRDLKELVTNLVAAETGDEVVLYVHGAGLLEVRVNYGDKYKGRWQASLWFDRVSRRVNIQWMLRPANADAGWGRKKFLVLASRWQASGYRFVHASPGAKGTENGFVMTGYYFWPKIGFDAPLTKAQRRGLPRAFRHVQTIRELYALPGGPEAWKEYGTALYGLTFDLENL